MSGRIPTARLAGLCALAGGLALAAGAALPPGPGRLAAVAAPLAALALAAVDAARCPRPAELRAGRGLSGPLRQGRPATVTLALAWNPGAGARGARPLWWADGAPPALVGRAPQGRALLRPGETCRASYAVLPQARGAARWSGPRATLGSPWGLWALRCDAALATEATVYPGPPPAAGPAREAAEHGAPSPGDAGLEFDGVRPYLPGEDARRMAWRATARRDQPVLRRLRPERGRRLLLVLDAGRRAAVAPSEGPGAVTRLDAFCAAALRVAAAALGAGDQVGIALLSSEQTRLLAPAAGPGALHTLATALAEVRPSAGDPDLRQAAAALLRWPQDALLWFGAAPSVQEARGPAALLGALRRTGPVSWLSVRPERLGPAPAGERAECLERAEREALAARAQALRSFAAAGVLARQATAAHLGALALDTYRQLVQGGGRG